MNFNVKCFKSILKEQNIKLENKKLNIFIGQNGVGKTNILEAIDWLINPSTKSVTTEKNPYHKGDGINFVSKTEVFMLTELTEANIVQINNVFKKYEIKDIDYSKLKKIEYKTPSITGNQYSFDSGDIKSAQKFLINKLLSAVYNNGNSWLMPEFFKKSSDLSGTLYYDNGLPTIQKMQINEEIKKKHSDLAEDIKTILLLTYDSRECTYVKNADYENILEYSYSFDQYKSTNSNKEFVELLNFVEQDTDLFGNLENLLKASGSQDEKEIIKSQNHLKKQIEDSSNEKIQKLFEQFDIYAYPEIISADNNLSLIVKDKNNYKIGNEETKFNSSGYKAFFHLIIKAENIRKKAKENSYTQFILLADEPDKNLHPNLQIQLINYLKKLCLEFSNIYVVLTTHSPFILKDLESNFCIVNKDNDGSTNLQYWQNNKKIKTNLLNSFSLMIAASLFNEEKDFASIFSRNKKFICDYQKMDEDEKKIVNEFSDKNGLNILPYESIVNNGVDVFINENSVDKHYSLKDLENMYAKSSILTDIQNDQIVLISKKEISD